MTRLARMAVVHAWLKADQSMMSFANDHGIQLCALLDWIMEYGQPPAALMWISVQILDGSVDTPQLNGGYSGYYPKPAVSLSRVFGQHWVPVVIQERS